MSKGQGQLTPFTRRFALQAIGTMTAGFALNDSVGSLAQSPTPRAVDSLIIDMVGAPDFLDPALARSTRDWSVVHSLFDSIAHLSDSGNIVPLAAESITQIDDLTIDVTLRPNLLFHDGSPVLSDAIRRGIEWVQQSEGPAVANFSVISSVTEVDERTARIVTESPAAWLLSQLAVWHVLFPASMTTELFTNAPIGSGPYRYLSGSASSEIVLEANPDYTWPSPKGYPLAQQVTFRFVPESVTRIADLATEQANIIQEVPIDQIDAVTETGATVIETSILGLAMLRIATDVAPFDDPRVCRALNHAVDVESIAQLLVSPSAHRIASLFPDERGIGFDSELMPFAYEPDMARALLEEAGYGDGFDLQFEYVSTERDDVISAISDQLADIGIRVTPISTDLASFNSRWTDPDSAPVRYVSWRPVFDPHTLLSLLFLSTGPLSRYSNPEADNLINGAARDTNPESRAEQYRELGRLMQDAPGAVYLWNLTSTYGVDSLAEGWEPRADDYLIPTITTGGPA